MRGRRPVWAAAMGTLAAVWTLVMVHWLGVAPAAFGARPPVPPRAPVEVPAAVAATHGSADEKEEAFESAALHFTSGRQRLARAAFAARDYGRAFRLLRQEGDEKPVRFLRALSGLRSGQVEHAAEVFPALAIEYPEMRDDCLFHGAIALDRLGREEEAARLLGDVSPDSSLYFQARLRRARLLVRARDVDRARGELSALASSAEAPSSLRARAEWELAELERQTKHPDAERRSRLRLWSEYPGSVWGERAGRKLRRIPDEARVRRAEVLLAQRKGEEARRTLHRVAARVPRYSALGCRIQIVRGEALRLERSYPEASAVFAPLARRCSDPEQVARALLGLARSRDGANELPAALAAYRQLAAMAQGAVRDEALLSAARLSAQRDEHAAASDHLEELLASTADAAMTAEALFQAFWISWKQDPATARLELLERLEALPAGAEDFDRDRARYWRARAIEAREDVEAARRAHEALALEAPLSFYGGEALARLRVLDLEAAVRVEVALEAPSVEPEVGDLRIPAHAPVRVRSAIERVRLGLPEGPAQLSGAALATGDAGLIRLAFHLLRAAGAEGEARALAIEAVRGPARTPEPANRALWRAAFPTRFTELIDRHARSAGIEPSLLAAVVREESGFVPDARSGAGAIGLTQLLPTTARAMARKAGLREPADAELVDPAINLRLGAAYLAELLARFDDRPAYVLASYNAGPTRVSSWIRERPDAPRDAWIEEIPFGETRNYVRRVLASQVAYQRMRPSSGLASGAAQR